jgi:hypothetical protein
LGTGRESFGRETQLSSTHDERWRLIHPLR